MSAKKTNLADRVSKMTTRPSAPPTGDASAPTAPMHRAPRTKPVRLSVDVSPQSHRFLVGWSAQISAEQGRARIAHTEILRVMLEELSQDEELQQRIARAIDRSYSQRA